MATKRVPIRLTDMYRRTSITPLSDIYWLAGYLEGEGCFSHLKERRFPRISLATTDYDVIDRVALLLDVGISFQKKRPLQNKPIYRLQLAGRRAVGWMMTLYPLMGKRRKQKILDLLRDWNP